MKKSVPPKAKHVFINCPFDKAYTPMLRATALVLMACGYSPRCALEADNATEVRVEKILRIIAECDLGIHDISRTKPDRLSKLPRFNMPFELGLFLGAAKLGDQKHRKKAALILDTEPYRYQKFLSDIAGQDIQAHKNNPDALFEAVRHWLNAQAPRNEVLPGKAALLKKYEHFKAKLPSLLKALKLKQNEISFLDWIKVIERWLNATAYAGRQDKSQKTANPASEPSHKRSSA